MHAMDMLILAISSLMEPAVTSKATRADKEGTSVHGGGLACPDEPSVGVDSGGLVVFGVRYKGRYGAGRRYAFLESPFPSSVFF